MNYIENLDGIHHIHLIGIGGISMSAIAETLNNWGYKVSGSDATASNITENLIKNGVEVSIGSNLELVRNSDFVIYSAAISENDPELIEAKKNSIPLADRGTFVGYLTRLYSESICVSGTHGKTTTTSMLSVCFLEAKLDPTIHVGAILKQLDGNYKIGNSEYFILEACEYKANFLHFVPNTAIVLNIDNDHLDFFKTFDNIKKTFCEYASLVDENGLLVTNADDSNCLDLKNHTNATFLTYGIENESANFVAKNISFDSNGFAIFDVYKNSEFYLQFHLSVPGKHNILNALACITVCDYYKIDSHIIQSGLLNYTGANRRLEYTGTIKNNVSVYDDYAHHPTEIKAVSDAIQNKTFNKSWVIFQPHTYSRTKNLLNDFADALSGFDNIIVTDIYAARERNTFNITSNDLVNKIIENGKNAIYIKDFDDIVSYIQKNTTNNDFVLTLGAGTVLNVGKMLVDNN